MQAQGVLRITDLQLWLSLGCTVAEQQNPHAVRVSLECLFNQAPRGAETDQLTDTVCYRTLVEAIQHALQPQVFQLIEHVAYQTYRTVCTVLQAHAQHQMITEIRVTAQKVAPPIPGLTGGVSFTYSGPPA